MKKLPQLLVLFVLVAIFILRLQPILMLKMLPDPISLGITLLNLLCLILIVVNKKWGMMLAMIFFIISIGDNLMLILRLFPKLSWPLLSLMIKRNLVFYLLPILGLVAAGWEKLNNFQRIN